VIVVVVCYRYLHTSMSQSTEASLQPTSVSSSVFIMLIVNECVTALSHLQCSDILLFYLRKGHLNILLYHSLVRCFWEMD